MVTYLYISQTEASVSVALLADADSDTISRSAKASGSDFFILSSLSKLGAYVSKIQTSHYCLHRMITIHVSTKYLEQKDN